MPEDIDQRIAYLAVTIAQLKTMRDGLYEAALDCWANEKKKNPVEVEHWLSVGRQADGAVHTLRDEQFGLEKDRIEREYRSKVAPQSGSVGLSTGQVPSDDELRQLNPELAAIDRAFAHGVKVRK